ncbi:hypothetical protein [Streptomyces carpinensis]|uniref:DUF5666 domain-containing protein n=1 Tax=Streptomyces carpinensis TaxID=66369 RepID=A0ABV1W031_9ACTN|nr:hypothetical protein [Streptomyces carpinensis]
MHATLRRRCVRTLAAGALSAALVSAGSAGAFAAGTAPMPEPNATHSMKPMAKASITIDHTSVKAGKSVMLSGRTANLAAATTLTVQHLSNGKWTTLRGATVVKKGNTFTVTTKLAATGRQHLRVVSGPTRSKTVTVNVT